MTRPTQLGRGGYPLDAVLGGEPGTPGTSTPSLDCCDVGETPPDRAAEGTAVTWQADVEELDDVNLSDGTVTDGGGSIGAFNNPSNANDDDPDTEASRGTHVGGAGTHTLALKSDLGASFEVVSHSLFGELFTGWGDTIVFQTSADGNDPWTTVTSTSYVTGGSGADETLVYTHDPETARYWRMLHSRTVAGLSSLGAVRIGTWAIQAETVASVVWNVPAPLVVDGDDATYETITGTDLIRLDLGAAHRIVRTRIRIATTNAGARTFTIKGANVPDFSDEVTLATIAFTATGSLTAQDVTGQWITNTAYRYFELSIGTSDTFRVHTWELYETTPGSIIVEDPTNGGAPDDLQDVLDNLAAEGASAHIADTSDAHDASAISIADAGAYFTGTDVEAALQELGASSATAVQVADVETHHRFLVLSHHGDLNEWPEDTLEGYRGAILKGAHGVDLDLRKTSDGVWVSIHDSTLDRTTNLTGNVSASSLATIQAGHIDGGYGYVGGTHGTSLDVPTLDDIIEALAPYDCTFWFDNKLADATSAGELAQYVVDNDLVSRVRINAYSAPEIAAIQAVSPDITIGGVHYGSLAYDDITSLSVVTAYAPQKIFGSVPVDEWGITDEGAVVDDLWAYGARGIIANDIDAALAAWRALEFAGGGGDHGALSGLGDDDHTQYLLRSVLTTRGDLYRRGAAAIERVALGTSGQVLTSDGTDAVWGDAVDAVGGHYEVIVSGSAPPVAVTNEAEDDWLYGWVPD